MLIMELLLRFRSLVLPGATAADKAVGDLSNHCNPWNTTKKANQLNLSH
jgi:hypothetical protein